MKVELKNRMYFLRFSGAELVCALLSFVLVTAVATAAPGTLEVRDAGPGCVRVTFKPQGYEQDLPDSPVLQRRAYPQPSLQIQDGDEARSAEVGGLKVEVLPHPLRVKISSADGALIQQLVMNEDGSVGFNLDDQPVLGLGEGGPRPGRNANWRERPVEFDRRGRLHKMEPRWQSDAYGSRNPVALLVGTSGWALYFNCPWGQIDLTDAAAGRFIPVEARNPAEMRQNHENQGRQLGKGIPPMESFVPGLLDVFVFDARLPAELMRNLSRISGAAAMPPKWALGYMQSHRTLEDDAQMIRIVDTFRSKRIPIDAVIYLGTGFTPRGWNTPQPSFDFNPEVFQRDPAEVIAELHERHVKVVLHIVPWDRDRLPTLQGSIPPQPGDLDDSSAIANYWKQHIGLVQAGVDAWWPDEGDWFDLFERMKRHQLYYEGPISTQPDRRPWSLHRNGHLGVARWGGWIWSGDTESSWKTLEAQIAVGINHSLSVGPYWGTDIGGFYSNPELTGELYARWFQFAAFCPSFRAHGRTWWTRLPWGWGLEELGPLEMRDPPLKSELNNPEIEPIARRYDELRYQLLSYNYTLAWQARETGMPFIRALWLHYPEDTGARGIGDEYLWGRDLLIAPVYSKGAVERELYLPKGAWYDWWTGEKRQGGKAITRKVDLATMPIYVRAGAILPIDPIRQYTAEPVEGPLTIRVYAGADGDYTLYEDDGSSLAYVRGEAALTRFRWRESSAKLSIEREVFGGGASSSGTRRLRIELQPSGESREVELIGNTAEVSFN